MWNVTVVFTSIVIGAIGPVIKRINKGTEEHGNKRMSGDFPNYNIIVIGENFEKSSGDLRRLVVTPTPVKNQKLRLM